MLLRAVGIPTTITRVRIIDRPDGTTERLFVESPDRPFYLERDKEDPELGRLVITFVPGADAGSGDAVE